MPRKAIMSYASDFCDWTREQKEEFAEQRMLEMKLKNAKLMQRHAEVEQDRIKAEGQNSAITNNAKIISPKEKVDYKQDHIERENKVEYSREWDRGKPDKEYWESPDHLVSYNYRTNKYMDKREDNSSRIENFDKFKGDYRSESSRNRRMRGNNDYKKHESYQKTSSYTNPLSPKRYRESVYKIKETSQNSFPVGKNDFNRSSQKNMSGSAMSDKGYIDKVTNVNASEKYLLQNDEISEDPNMQYNVNEWLTTVNKSSNWTDKDIAAQHKSKSDKRYYKFGTHKHTSHSTSDSESDDNLNDDSHVRKYQASSNVVPHEQFSQNEQNCQQSTHKSTAKQPNETKSSYSVAGNKNDCKKSQGGYEHKGFKSDYKDRFNKSKIYIKSKSFSASNRKHYEHNSYSNKDSNEDAACKMDDGTWSHIEQSHGGKWDDVEECDGGTWSNVKQSPGGKWEDEEYDDSKWSSAEQSHGGKLKDVEESNDGIRKNVKQCNENVWKNEKLSNEYDGIWANTEPPDIEEDLSGEESYSLGYKDQIQVECGPRNTRVVLSKKSEKKGPIKTVVNKKIQKEIKASKKAKNVKGKTYSEDTGWSTVSEEGDAA